MKGKPAVIIADTGEVVGPRSRIFRSDCSRSLTDVVSNLRRMATAFQLVLLPDLSRPGESSQTPIEKGDGGVRWLADVLEAAGISVRLPEKDSRTVDPGRWSMEEYSRRLQETSETLGLDLNASFFVCGQVGTLAAIPDFGGFVICIRGERGEGPRGQLSPNAVAVSDLHEVADWVLGEEELRRRLGDADRAVREAAHCLRVGGVVAFPTETVYGLGANALDERAVARIFEIKQRPRFDPLIVHVADAQVAREFVDSLPEVAVRLMDRFWPGPLTLVLPKRPCVPDLVTAGWPTVALRSPRHPLAWRLLREVDFPIAAPSANRFGAVSPTTAEAVREQLGHQIGILLDGGPCPVGLESTVVAVENDGRLTLLRPGGLPVEEVEVLVGPVARTRGHDDRPRAPGGLPRHYAPRTPLQLFKTSPPPNPRAGVLAFQTPPPPDAFGAVEVLSSRGDLREAAARLFEALRRLDARGLDILYAEIVPEIGLGQAINDRLRRASEPEGGGV